MDNLIYIRMLWHVIATRFSRQIIVPKMIFIHLLNSLFYTFIYIHIHTGLLPYQIGNIVLKIWILIKRKTLIHECWIDIQWDYVCLILIFLIQISNAYNKHHSKILGICQLLIVLQESEIRYDFYVTIVTIMLLLCYDEKNDYCEWHVMCFYSCYLHF